jgi:hypothetical protein
MKRLRPCKTSQKKKKNELRRLDSISDILPSVNLNATTLDRAGPSDSAKSKNEPAGLSNVDNSSYDTTSSLARARVMADDRPPILADITQITIEECIQKAVWSADFRYVLEKMDDLGITPLEQERIMSDVFEANRRLLANCDISPFECCLTSLWKLSNPKMMQRSGQVVYFSAFFLSLPVEMTVTLVVAGALAFSAPKQVTEISRDILRRFSPKAKEREDFCRRTVCRIVDKLAQADSEPSRAIEEYEHGSWWQDRFDARKKAEALPEGQTRARSEKTPQNLVTNKKDE